MVLRSTDWVDRLDPDEADALAVTEWLAVRSGSLPWSAWEDLYDYAHENPDAWPLVKLPEGIDRSTAAALMASRAPLEPRFNPYHGKDGKFASANGTRMGSWVEDDLPTARAIQAEENMANLGDGKTSMRAMEILAERQIPDGSRVFTAPDGSRTLVHKEADVSDEDLGVFFKNMDEMKARFPTPPAKIAIQPAWKFTDNALAETVISKPRFRFSDRSLRPGGLRFDKDQTFHPKAFYENPRRNLVAHEYGHAIAKPDKISDVMFWNDNKWTLSRYGRHDVYEGFAEAFGEYATGSPGSISAATKAYATRYGWTG